MDMTDALEKYRRRMALYERQSKWAGTSLVVKPCWFKRLLWIAGSLPLTFWLAVNLLQSRPEDLEHALVLSLLTLLTLVAAYTYWLTSVGLIRELRAGYSLKVDASGVTLAGYPTMPWKGVYRAGHTWRENEGMVSHELQLEFSARLLRKRWPKAWRTFFMGPLPVPFLLLQRKGLLRLTGAFLSLPVPTIAAAIRIIGCRYAPHPVVKWEPHESLEDARRLAVLMSTASQPAADSGISTAFERAAKAFSKPNSRLDQAELDAALATHNAKETTKSDALQEYWSLYRQTTSHSHRKTLEAANRDLKAFHRVWIGIVVLVVVFNVLRYLVV